MAYQVQIESKRQIYNIDELKKEFPNDSPVPGFVFYELIEKSKIYFKKAIFNIQLLYEIGEKVGDITTLRQNFIGEKKQTLFFTRSGKTFIYPFLEINIGTILKKICPNRDYMNIEKIIIVTKYNWHNPKEEILEQDRSILIFDLLPEDRKILEQELQKF